mgnify:CR=1 FL=1
MAKAAPSHPCAHLRCAALPQVRRKEARSVSVGLRCSAWGARAGRAMRAHKSNSTSRLIANGFRLLWH